MTQTPANSEPSTRHAKRKPALPSAHGEPAIWVMGAALVLSVVMIIGVFALILVEGARTFWPRPIERLTLSSGQVVLGIETERDEEGRTLFRTGNRDIGQAPFRWIADDEIVSRERPAEVVMLERTDWGVWLGEPQAVVKIDSSGDRTTLAEGPGPALAKLQEVLADVRAQARRVEQRTKHELGDINRRIEQLRLKVRGAELKAERAATARDPLLAWWGVGLVLVIAAGCIGAGLRLKPLVEASPLRRAVRGGARALLMAAAAGCVLFALLESPARRNTMDAARLTEIRVAAQTEIESLERRYQTVQAEIQAQREASQELRLVITEPTTGQMSPTRQTSPGDPMYVSQVVRVIPANALSWGGKMRVYLSRWTEFLMQEPRNSNTEGGVFPVIFGTVTLTILLAVAVVPLGVIAALYLREYARQGTLVSLIRIAVNNLAGVPSVVYGVFGLGFFAYSVGAYIDAGPRAPVPSGTWWWGIAGCAVLIALAVSAGAWARGVNEPAVRRRLGGVMGAGWLLATCLAVWAVWTTPYFGGFFAEKLPTSTFGSKGILWASLTLALLTLPVVIVATEEAIAAVPRSMREGSYGCGASKWQTVRRIVLPQALPGIMTGAILAMARGAGEVAPLMLLGAVKTAPELPIDAQFPYIHAERSFMHLGFHIFDLGFQSPDSQAARPLVWTTTLLLVLIVLALNLSAIIIRARLRAKVVNATV